MIFFVVIGEYFMDFLEKLDVLKSLKNLNNSDLSRESGIPYTTINTWYKNGGYEGMKLSTLRKLSDYFNVSLAYWADEDNYKLSMEETLLVERYRTRTEFKAAINKLLDIEVTE